MLPILTFSFHCSLVCSSGSLHRRRRYVAFADPLNMCPLPFSRLYRSPSNSHNLPFYYFAATQYSSLKRARFSISDDAEEHTKNCNNVYLPFSIRKQRSWEGEKSISSSVLKIINIIKIAINYSL